jgi:carotenoid phi-ring synthase / carotenoid chi-ring synthase
VPPRVAIIGAGLAGLSAAVELSDAGLDVVVLEKGDRAGGRLSAWRDADGDSVEHGIHGWWHQYFNAFALLERVGIPDDVFFRDPFPSSMINQDGTRIDLRWLQHRYPTPIYLLYFLSLLRGLRPADYVFAVPALSRVLSFVHSRDLVPYDALSMYGYLEKWGASGPLHEVLISPFARSFGFSSTEELSAGAVMSALSFYLVGHQDDVKARWCRGNPQELIVEPIARHVEVHGGRVELGAPVVGLEVDQSRNTPGRINAVITGASAAQLRIPLASLSSSVPLAVDAPSQARVWIRRADDGAIALSATCTHQGCRVDYVAEGVFSCPCHGSRFDLAGAVLRGPAMQPLDQLGVRVEGPDAVVDVGAQTSRVEADFFILATDVEATKRIFSAEPRMASLPGIRKVFNLEATEVIVARMWLDKHVSEDLTVGVFTGLGLLDNYFVLSNYQDEFRNYDGTVIELQLYVVRDYIHLTDDDLQPLILNELGKRIPELDGARVRKWAVNRLADVFSHFNVGSETSRPEVKSPYDNLYFAGDWLKVDEPWWMMERAVVTGKLAANEILRSIGIATTEILRPRADEPFTRAMKTVTAASLGVGRILERIAGYRTLRP